MSIFGIEKYENRGYMDTFKRDYTSPVESLTSLSRTQIVSKFSFPEAKNAKLGFVVPSQCEERRKKIWAGSEEAFKAFDEMPRLDLLVRADRVDWH
jgi:hypothetical protein